MTLKSATFSFIPSLLHLYSPAINSTHSHIFLFQASVTANIPIRMTFAQALHSQLLYVR